MLSKLAIHHSINRIAGCGENPEDKVADVKPAEKKWASR